MKCAEEVADVDWANCEDCFSFLASCCHSRHSFETSASAVENGFECVTDAPDNQARVLVLGDPFLAKSNICE